MPPGFQNWRRVTAQAALVRGIDVAAGYAARERFRGRMRVLFNEVDLLLTPGLGGLLPRWDEMAALQSDFGAFSNTIGRFTTPFNMAGSPTISLPAGFTSEGLPLGIQLAAPWMCESALIRAGVAFQKQTDFHKRHPDLM
jgi:amidase